MSKEKWFTQVELRQPCDVAGNSYKIYLAWIPSEFAVRNKWLKIDGKDGTWRVTHIFSKKPKSWLLSKENEHLPSVSVR